MALIDLLPDYYKNSEHVVDLQNAIGEVIDELVNARMDLFEQLFVDQATSGLELWEKALGITTDLSKPYELRRAQIQAKLRGRNACTTSMIKNLINSYFTNAEVEEKHSSYFFSALFNGSFGDTNRIISLKKDIEYVKPAHLDYDVRYQDNESGDAYIGSYVSNITSYVFEQKEEDA